MNKPFLCAFTAACVMLVGCGGSSSGGGGSSQNPSQYLTAGINDLNSVLQSQSSNDTSTVTDAANNFKSAYTLSPTGQAAVGYVVASSALDAQSIAQTIGSTLSPNTATTPLLLRLANNLTVLKKATKSLAVFPVTKSPLEVLPQNILASATAPKVRLGATINYNQLIAAVQSADTSITTLLPYLSNSVIVGLETTPLVLTVSGGQQVKIGTAEAYALRSALEAMKGATDMLLAYNLNPGTFNFNAVFYTAFSTYFTSGSNPITPALYLPGSGFGQLTTAARVTDFGTQWTAAGNDANNGLSQISTRMSNTSTGWLTDYLEGTSYTSANVTSQQGYVNQFLDVLTQTQTVNVTNSTGDTATITVNLPAWIGSNGVPPTDLTRFFPSVDASLVSGSTTEMQLQVVQGSIADPTFGNLITGLSQSSPVLYDRSLQYDTSTSVGTVDLGLFAFFTN